MSHIIKFDTLINIYKYKFWYFLLFCIIYRNISEQVELLIEKTML